MTSVRKRDIGIMQNKWLLYGAVGFLMFGLMGWTRTAYYLWTHPNASQEQKVEAQDNPHAPLVAAARNDLAARLQTMPEKIEVVAVQEMTWPDSSLGCPKRDAMYAQVLQEGLQIVLKDSVKTYHYHSGPQQQPFLCEK